MMKMFSYIVRFLLIMSVGASLSSCSGVDFPEGNVREERDYPVLLATSGVDTRISIDGTAMVWDEDDCIHLTAVAEDDARGEATLAFYNYLTEGDRHAASFSGFVTMTSVPKECYFVYPQSSFSSVDPDSGVLTLYYNNQSGEHEPVLYAAAEYSEIGVNETLTHVGAMLEIEVAMEGVSQITFVGNCLEKLSPVYVDTGSGEVTVASESSYNVQITVPVQSEGKTYIAVPPVNMNKGFSLICSNADASVSMIRTFSTDGGTASGYDFSTRVGQIIPVTLEGTLTGYSVTCSAPVVSHTRKDGLLYETSVTFSMNKQGASDKIIEEWGANFIRNRNPLDPDSKDVVVRTVAYTNENPIVSDASVAMNKVDGWPLLPAGEYTFAPYYKIYGQAVSLASQTITVADPGITLEISGQTSYDKYLAGNLDGTGGANSHANNLIEGVQVSTNVHLDIISSYAATLSGADMSADLDGISSGASVVASYGNLTRTSFKSYPMAATLVVGGITLTADRTFHLTGLPYEVNFASGNPTNLSPAWGTPLGSAEYSDNRITYKGGLISDADGAIVSPEFYIPDNEITVLTYADVCCKKDDTKLHVEPCALGCETIKFGSVTVTAHKIGAFSSLSSKGYIQASSTVVLNNSASCLMYAATGPAYSYNVGFYQVKINYAN